MKPFRILKTERILWEKYYKVEKHRVEFPDGSEGDWFIKVNPDAVIIVPIKANGEILLQKNYKHGCGEVITEFCAGMIDEGETWEQAAPRELEEETGYQAEKYIKLGEAFANPTSSAMKYHIVLAKNIKPTGTLALEPAEQVEPFWVGNLEKADEIFQKGQIQTSSATLMAFHWAQRHLK